MSLGRREVLQAFLGAPVALAACRRSGRARPRLPEGELVGPSVALGHELREVGLIEPPPDRWEDAGVVVIGGGVAGLAACWRLLGAGLEDVVLLELEPQLGGTSQEGRGATGGYPWGAHYITAPMQESRALVRLLGELGALEGTDERGEPVVAEEHLCRDPEQRLFYLGRWYEGLYLHAGASAEDEAQYAAFEAVIGRLAGWRDGRGRRAFALPSSQCSDDVEITALDRMSMAAWMDGQGFTSPRLRWYVDYACRDDYGLGLEHTSAWAGLFYYAARVRDARREYQPVVTWPEGNGRLVAHMARGLGPRARVGWAAADVRPVAGAGGVGGAGGAGEAHIEVVALTEGGRAAAGIRAEQVIFAAPQFVARHVIRDLRDAGGHARSFEYGPWMVANLHLRDRPASAGFELAWDNVLHDSPSLGYVVSTHQRGLDRGPTVITYYHPLLDPDGGAARQRMLEAGFEDWADVALSDLERAHADIRALCERIDIMRWGHGMIRPVPGFVWSRARLDAARPYRGVHFAHSDLSGLALFEEALDHGVRAAEEVLAARGVAVTTWR